MTEPFILASQTKQAFYVTDPSDKKWSIVLQEKYISHSDENQDLNFDISETPSYTTYVHISYEEIDTNNVHVICYDH